MILQEQAFRVQNNKIFLSRLGWPASVAFFPAALGPGSGVAAHIGSPPLLSGSELPRGLEPGCVAGGAVNSTLPRLAPQETYLATATAQVKSSCYSPNFIEQTAHCDRKPRAAWVHLRLLLHRRSAAGWAECMIYSALVSFF